MLILNVAAGKFSPLPVYYEGMDDGDSERKFVVNVDTSYYSDKEVKYLQPEIDIWEKGAGKDYQEADININIFEFMERTKLQFDKVVIYRFLEHVSFTQVEYFIYLVSTVLKKDGIVDVIVPDYKILSELLLSEDSYLNSPDFNFQRHNIKLTTEMLNEPSCPHASIWTEMRMKYFWELEERFKVLRNHIGFKFDGRDLYLRSIIQRL